jgi:hypothetical protein
VTRVRIQYPDAAIVVRDRPPRRPARAMAASAARDRAPAIVAFGTTATDLDLFADGVGSTCLLYLPRYRVLDEIVSGRPRACMRFTHDPQGFQLTVRLAHVAAPELGDDAGGAEPHDVAHEVALAFTPRRGDGTALPRRELRFHEVTVEPTGLRATLRMRSTDERDAVHAALTDRTWDASLAVHRRFAVARRADLPLFHRLDVDGYALLDAVDQVRAAAPPVVPGLTPGAVRALVVDLVDAAYRTVDPRRTKHAYHSRDGLDHLLAGVEPQLVRIGATVAQLGGGRGAVPAPLALVRDLAARCQQHLTALRGALGTYQTATVELPWVLERSPFVFAKDLYGYIYADLEQPADGLVRREVGSGDRWQRYYQDWAERHRFYYLPDRFALEAAPAPAQVNVRVGPQPQDRYLLQYTAVPVIEAHRLERDAAALARHAPADAELELVPLAAERVDFHVRVPRPDLPALWERQHRPGAIQRLDAPLRDALALSTRDLATVIGAMFTARGSFFTGEIEAKVADFATEHIPFDGHIPHADRGPIWDAIYDAGPAETTPITIKITPGYFAQAGLAAVEVELEAGTAARLTAAAPQQTVALRTPLRTFVCGDADDRSYRYRTTLVPVGGRPVTTLPADGSWSTATDTILRPRLT